MKFVPWRLLFFLFIVIIIAFFAGFNLQPVSISLGFYIFKDIPLFLALIFFFILGALVMVPFTILGKMPKNNLKHKERKKSWRLAARELDVNVSNIDNKETTSKKKQHKAETI